MSEPYSWQETIVPRYRSRSGVQMCMPRRLVPSKLRNRTSSPRMGSKSTGPIDSGGGVSTKMFRQMRTYLLMVATMNTNSDRQVKVIATAAQWVVMNVQTQSVEQSVKAAKSITAREYPPADLQFKAGRARFVVSKGQKFHRSYGRIRYNASSLHSCGGDVTGLAWCELGRALSRGGPDRGIYET